MPTEHAAPAIASLDTIKARLRWFAEHDASDISPLYALLAGHIAEDDAIAGLLQATRAEFAHPTLLMAAVHRVVLSDPIGPLSDYYPSVGGTFGADESVWPLFRSYVLAHANRIRQLIATHTTQTNEVRRSAALYIGLAEAAQDARGPIGLLEVGTSAGLLLGVDSYGYRFEIQGRDAIVVGPPKAQLVLSTTIEIPPGAPLPYIPKRLAVAAKIGVDRNPVDLSDEDAFSWQEACIFADQPARLQRLRQAAGVQRKSRPELVTGDAVDDLAAVADRIPSALPLVVFNSHTLAYLSQERRQAYVQALAQLSQKRRLWWVSQEGRLGIDPVIEAEEALSEYSDGGQFLTNLLVTRWDSGTPHVTALAQTAAHGQFMRWLGN